MRHFILATTAAAALFMAAAPTQADIRITYPAEFKASIAGINTRKVFEGPQTAYTNKSTAKKAAGLPTILSGALSVGPQITILDGTRVWTATDSAGNNWLGVSDIYARKFPDNIYITDSDLAGTIFFSTQKDYAEISKAVKDGTIAQITDLSDFITDNDAALARIDILASPGTMKEKH